MSVRYSVQEYEKTKTVSDNSDSCGTCGLKNHTESECGAFWKQKKSYTQEECEAYVRVRLNHEDKRISFTREDLRRVKPGDKVYWDYCVPGHSTEECKGKTNNVGDSETSNNVETGNKPTEKYVVSNPLEKLATPSGVENDPCREPGPGPGFREEPICGASGSVREARNFSVGKSCSKNVNHESLVGVKKQPQVLPYHYLGKKVCNWCTGNLYCMECNDNGDNQGSKTKEQNIQNILSRVPKESIQPRDEFYFASTQEEELKRMEGVFKKHNDILNDIVEATQGEVDTEIIKESKEKLGLISEPFEGTFQTTDDSYKTDSYGKYKSEKIEIIGTIDNGGMTIKNGICSITMESVRMFGEPFIDISGVKINLNVFKNIQSLEIRDYSDSFIRDGELIIQSGGNKFTVKIQSMQRMVISRALDEIEKFITKTNF